MPKLNQKKKLVKQRNVLMCLNKMSIEVLLLMPEDSDKAGNLLDI